MLKFKDMLMTKVEDIIVKEVRSFVFWWRQFKTDPLRWVGAILSFIGFIFIVWIVMSWWNVITTDGIFGEARDISSWNLFNIYLT